MLFADAHYQWESVMGRSAVQLARELHPLNIPFDEFHPLTKRAMLDFQCRYEHTFHIHLTFSGFYSRFKLGRDVRNIARDANARRPSEVLEIYDEFFKHLFGDMKYEQYCSWSVANYELVKLSSSTVLQRLALNAIRAGIEVAPDTIRRRDGGGRFKRAPKTWGLLLNGHPWEVHLHSKAHQSRRKYYDYFYAQFKVAKIESLAGVVVYADIKGHPERIFVLPQGLLLAEGSRVSGGLEVSVRLSMSDRATGNDRKLDQCIDAWHLAKRSIPIKPHQ